MPRHLSWSRGQVRVYEDPALALMFYVGEARRMIAAVRAMGPLK